jgi:hypothetical protein
MRGTNTFSALAVGAALGVLGSTSAVAMKDDMGDRGEPDRSVVPCSLTGVNPAAHPEIFGNPAVAASYGFVRSRDGAWHVVPNCRR